MRAMQRETNGNINRDDDKLPSQLCPKPAEFLDTEPHSNYWQTIGLEPPNAIVTFK